MKPNAKTTNSPVQATSPGGLIGLFLAFLLHIAWAGGAQAAKDQTDYQYDAGGNLTHQTSPAAASGMTVTTDLDYDSLGRNTLITQPDPGNGGQQPIISLGYDLLDQLTKVSDQRAVPALDTLTPTTGLGTVNYTDSPDSGKNAVNNAYDAAGNLRTETDARGIATNYQYDALNRLACIEYNASTPDCSSPGRTDFIYDSAGVSSIGKLTELRDEAGTTTYSYDASGRLATKTQRLDGGQSAWTLAVAYTYGTAGTAALGKIKTLTYPSGNQVSYSYNAAGQISAISYKPANSNGLGTDTAASPVTLMSSIKYTPDGRFYSGFWGNTTSAAPHSNLHGNDLARLDGRIKSVRLGHSGVTLGGLTRTLQYDDAGRVTAMTHSGSTLGSQTPASFNQSFSYDNLGRLTGYTKGTASQSYSYDASGNRIALNGNSYSIGAPGDTDMDTLNNRVLKASINGFTRLYDNAGNLKEDASYQYGYSARGRLQSITRKSDGAVFTYAYNGLGQRVKKTNSTSVTGVTQYVYDGQGHLLGEYDYYGRPLQETVYLGDLPIAVLNQVVGGGNGSQALSADNSAGSASPAANWPSLTDTAAQGGSHQTHAAVAGTSSDRFTWTLNLAGPGKYFIQARWAIPAGAAMADDATYTLTGANTGTTVRAVDQGGNGNTWTYLGLMAVDAAGPVTVQLSPSTTGIVSADAVRALPVTNAATNANYIYTDHLYAPRVIVRASDNQMVWRWDNADPFGVGQPDTNPAGLATAYTYNPRFPGQIADGETGLFYNYHRHYSPAIGGYTQPDPIGLDGGQMGLYAYVNGNPVNLVDPTGLIAGVDDAVVIGGGVIVGSLYCAIYPDRCRKIAEICANGIDKMFNEASDNSGDKHPSTPTGQKGSPIDVQPGTNEPTAIGGRDYGGHALDQMQGRGVPPSVVEDAIQNGQSSPDPIPGRTRYYNPDNNVTVITENDGTVVTVINGKR